jgi:hypothetical protein
MRAYTLQKQNKTVNFFHLLQFSYNWTILCSYTFQKLHPDLTKHKGPFEVLTIFVYTLFLLTHVEQ